MPRKNGPFTAGMYANKEKTSEGVGNRSRKIRVPHIMLLLAILAIIISFFQIHQQNSVDKVQLSGFEIQRYEKAKADILNQKLHTNDRIKAFEILIEKGELRNIDFAQTSDARLFFRVCRAGLSLVNVNFSNLNLSKTCFEKYEFTDVKFNGANLSRADFSRSTTSELGNFENAIVENANFSGFQLSYMGRGPQSINTLGSCWVWSEFKKNYLKCRYINSELKTYWEKTSGSVGRSPDDKTYMYTKPFKPSGVIIEFNGNSAKIKNSKGEVIVEDAEEILNDNKLFSYENVKKSGMPADFDKLKTAPTIEEIYDFERKRDMLRSQNNLTWLYKSIQ